MTCSGKRADILVAVQSAAVGVMKDGVRKLSRDQIMEDVFYSFGLSFIDGLILKITGVKMSWKPIFFSCKVDSTVCLQCVSLMGTFHLLVQPLGQLSNQQKADRAAHKPLP